MYKASQAQEFLFLNACPMLFPLFDKYQFIRNLHEDAERGIGGNCHGYVLVDVLSLW